MAVTPCQTLKPDGYSPGHCGVERNAQKSTLQFPTGWCNVRSLRRGDREADGARLESGCSESYRGFESPPLRHNNKKTDSPLGGFEAERALT